ncbi:MAG: phospho-sugar mutase [Erysipelotrichaceae bacterium]
MWKENYNKWLNQPDLDANLKNELQQLNEQEIKEAFNGDLAFGTAGMRGIMGPGTNRMNIYTLRKANIGYAQFILSLPQGKERGVAIAYDNRHNSYEFANESAKILASFNIKVYLYTSLRPTPQLSFTIRELNCAGGIVCTASHNPKEYNGYKIYDDTGCQLPPESIEPVIKNIEAVKNILDFKLNLTSEQESLIEYIDSDLDTLYLEKVKTVQYHQDLAKNIKIVFTPQHGTASIPMKRLFSETGYNCIEVVEQATADPDFTNTEVANPEDPKAYTLALQYAKKYDADIILSADPDADRMGVQVKHNNEYVFLTGNQTGALLIEYICSSLKQANKFPNKPLVCSTIVTNELGNVVARSYGCEVVLSYTGFKFVGQKIKQLCDDDNYDFVFGYEESYGSIVQSFVRDKDSLQACLTLAEAANYYQTQGKTLVDVVEELYQKHGAYYDNQEVLMIPGADGLEKMQNILANLRNNPPQEFAGLKVVKAEDYGNLSRVIAGVSEPIVGFVQADVLKYFLEDGSWVAIRPSGTEPKCKFYYCVIDDTIEKAKLKKAKLSEAFAKEINN